MLRLDLKDYQNESLEVLKAYASTVRGYALGGSRHPDQYGFKDVTGRDYRSAPGFDGVPYVCLRIPTGGGKTILGAHAVGVIARSLLAIDRPVCLWITPSTTIRDQTLRGLQDSRHPYRAALEEQLGAEIEVMTLEDALTRPQFVRPQGPAIVIVTTIQSYRVRDERTGVEIDATRRIYRDNGYMKEPLENLPAEIARTLQRDESGLVQLSLANALRVRQPIVIMDEAHNARTPTSFESLARFGPCFVLELTATPELTHDTTNRTKPRFASNVLHSVSALALKAEGMIKLPVELQSRATWHDVLAATVQRRDELEAIATAHARRLRAPPVRPIALIQAQPNSDTRETYSVRVVKSAIIDNLGIDEEQVRICTGPDDELGDTDLTDPACPVRYIVTVQKLREGWDCPWAYVLGSVGNTATATAVEQLIGRILRMPGAAPTEVAALDRAYAFVLSDDVVATATKLRDRMVETCGFDNRSATEALRVHVKPDQIGLGFDRIPLSRPPALDQLPESLARTSRWDEASSSLVLDNVPTQAELRQLRDAVDGPDDKKAVDEAWEFARPPGVAPKLLTEFAEPFSVPQLTVQSEDRRFLFDPIELDQFEWNLDACSPTFSEGELTSELLAGKAASIDLEPATDADGGLVTRAAGEVRLRQLEFISQDDDWSAAQLAAWIDREIHRGNSLIGLPLSYSQPYILRVLNSLTSEREFALPMLVRRRHELAECVRTRVVDHGRTQMRKAAELLFRESPESVSTDQDFSIAVEEQLYNPPRDYDGNHRFERHAFALIGHMNDEEVECAIRIGTHPSVQRWLRNLEHRSHGGFSLPKSPGQFFPDFIVEFKDKRLALIEYKNGGLASQPGELHKRDIGQLWAERSSEGHRFGWIVDRDWACLDDVLSGRTNVAASG